MTDAKTTRIDVRREINTEHVDPFYWVLQTTAPVQDLFRSVYTFDTRAAAVYDFMQTAEALGWKTMVSLDWEPPPAETDDDDEPF